MASNYKMKGFFKGFKIISQIFAAKEQEMVIGRPTDVKHVAHIGWSSSTPGTLTGNASPSWMNVIEGSSDFSSLGYFAPSAGTSWTSQDFDQQHQLPRDMLPLGIASEITREDVAAAPCPDVPRPPPRKTRQKKKTTIGSLVNSSMPNDSSASASTAATTVVADSIDTNGVMW
ncbi:CRIB domain-containing protein RIC10-like [Triticum dicoccoides]|uniref:CRIB domain-containing protein RIC10-like n=1 Tax=Triticum dicoccoides TaxID=85692 RepID=UPI000E7A843F|nr:CRIB domain-containing protein RIC10-like [Triticum dicoccoides]